MDQQQLPVSSEVVWRALLPYIDRADGQLLLRMGDSSGSRSVRLVNASGNPVLYLDSDGVVRGVDDLELESGTSGDITLKLGDDAGANKVEIQDSSGAAVAEVNSDGDISGADVAASGAVSAATVTTTGDVAVGDDLTVTDDLMLGGSIAPYNWSELTISSGEITPISWYHSVDTEGSAANDDLDTINTSGTRDGTLLIIRCASATRDVLVRSRQDNIYLDGDADFSLNAVRDRLMLQRHGSIWVEVSRSNN